jgi:thiamine-monophosphate kinase
MPSEFALIRKHFTRPARHTDLAVGDDAALIRPSAGMQLAISTDMLVAGTHFFADTDPEDLGWKTLAVNVSDLAAMGAQPRWVVLAASLPAADEAWIAAFAGASSPAAKPSASTPSAATPPAARSTCARPSSAKCPSAGHHPRRRPAGRRPVGVRRPGRAALGLAHLRGETTSPTDRADCLAALHRPQPRVALGLALRGLASACSTSPTACWATSATSSNNPRSAP